MDLGKDFYLEYVEAMNREYKFGASEETMHLIAQLAHHLKNSPQYGWRNNLGARFIKNDLRSSMKAENDSTRSL